MYDNIPLAERQLLFIRLRMSIGLFVVVMLTGYDIMVPYSIKEFISLVSFTHTSVIIAILMFVPYVSYIIIASTFRFVDTNLRFTIPLIWILIHYIRMVLPADLARGFMILALLILTVVFSYIIAKSHL